MKIIKALMVAAMALFLTITTIDNLTMPDVGLGAVGTAMGMETTFKHPAAMWRAMPAKLPTMAVFAAIVVFEAVAAIICWAGAVRMWRARADARAFKDATAMANLGLAATALLYFGAFLVVGTEWFLMWQSQQLSVALEVAFRMFTASVLIMLYIAMVDDG
ncbi:MAG: DUF2165 domain-containing protein [Gammaproteobacteria bacterium]|nr:DUF2165 domain-containing protein [Gammaproteobacteria bacterium]